MKMTQAHYGSLKAAFVSTLSAEVERLAGHSDLPTSVKDLVERHVKEYAQAGLSECRMHFDLFWWVNRRADLKGLMKEFYMYANDDHLHTALKAIVKEIRA